MKISEIFYSIEGEGIDIGKPMIFIRLAGCNLRCSWCDTKYSLENGIDMSISEIINEITKYSCSNISITGGEPLIQKKELISLIKKLKNMRYWLQINTNGTIFSKSIFTIVDRVTMDCKCISSNEKSDLDVLNKTMNFFNEKSQFKFIISDIKDYNYAKNILLSVLRNSKNIIFQPEWNNRIIVKELIKKVQDDKLNVRIIGQYNKYINLK